MFVLALWLPLVDSGYHLDTSSATMENRRLAPFPAMPDRAAGIKTYFAGLESYFNDHFGFRNLLIRTHGYIRWHWLKQGSTEVLAGREGWLFYTGENTLDSHLGLSFLTGQELEKWRQLLERRQRWLAKHGMKYLFVIAPDKESIYPEYLPSWAEGRQVRTRLDQFVAYLQNHSNLPILDLRPALRAAKTNDFIYIKTDTHWNALGAYFGYREIIRTLGQQLPGMAPLPLEDFDVRRAPDEAADLARFLAQEHSMNEPNYIFLIPRPPLQTPEAIADVSILPKPWPPNEQPLVINNPARQYRAVVFRDSFASFLVPFLGQHFNRIVFVWQRSWNLDVIRREQPDIVIDEMLERYLVTPLVDSREEVTDESS
jgi:hypothetical protein